MDSEKMDFFMALAKRFIEAENFTLGIGTKANGMAKVLYSSVKVIATLAIGKMIIWMEKAL